MSALNGKRDRISRTDGIQNMTRTIMLVGNVCGAQLMIVLQAGPIFFPADLGLSELGLSDRDDVQVHGLMMAMLWA